MAKVFVDFVVVVVVVSQTCKTISRSISTPTMWLHVHVAL